MKIYRLILAVSLFFVFLGSASAVTFPPNDFVIISPDIAEEIDARGFTVVSKGGLHPGHQYRLSLVVINNTVAATYTAQVAFDSGTGDATFVFSDSPNLEVLKPRPFKGNMTDDFTFVVDVVNIPDFRRLTIQVILEDMTLVPSATIVKQITVFNRDNGGCPPGTVPPTCEPDPGGGGF